MRSIYSLMLAVLLVTIVMLLPVATNTDLVVTYEQQAYVVQEKTIELCQDLESFIPITVYRSLTQAGTQYHDAPITWRVTTRIMVGAFLMQKIKEFASGE